MLSWLWSRSVVYNAMFHSCPLFCISLDRWSVWLLYHPLLWWCYCWWCWWPGGEQSVTLVPSFVSLLYHSALLLSAGWSLVLSTNHWSLPQWLRQNFCCWNITKCNKWYNSNVHPNPYKRNKYIMISLKKNPSNPYNRKKNIFFDSASLCSKWYFWGKKTALGRLLSGPIPLTVSGPTITSSNTIQRQKTKTIQRQKTNTR